MRYVSLFSGIGGFDLGFDEAGMECAAQVEIDERAVEVLDRHWPNVPKYRDVRSFGNGQFARGTIDLVCGGFPCQDVSVAGRRAGLAGERSGLWFEFARVIDELEPRWVVIENVPGLLSSGGGADFAVILQWLVKRGYGVAWRILDAQYFGVPQRRRRVFLVASFGTGRAAEVLFESESLPGDPPEGGEAGKEVAFTPGADASRSGDKGDGGINQTLIPSAEIASPLTASGRGTERAGESRGQDTLVAAYGGNKTSGPIELATARSTRNNRIDFESDTFVVDARNVSGSDVSMTLQSKKDGYSVNTVPLVFQQNSRSEVRLIGGNGASSGAVTAGPGVQQQNYVAYNIMPQHSAKDYKAKETDISQSLDTGGNHNGNQGGTYVSFTPRASSGRSMSVDEIVPTLESTNNGAPAVSSPNSGVRRLTPVECARLQGFPDDWNDWLPDTARYKQYGNAVAVPCARWLGARIMRIE